MTTSKDKFCISNDQELKENILLDTQLPQFSFERKANENPEGSTSKFKMDLECMKLKLNKKSHSNQI